MSRFLLAVAGVALLCVVALGVLWLAGQLLVGVGAVAVGTAGVLLRLLWFLSLTALAGGLVYFVASAWRPGQRVPDRPVSAGGPGAKELVISAVPTVQVQENRVES